MNRQEKQQEVAALHELFAEARNAYLVDFRGLTVTQATDLRRKVRASQSSYRVVKNTLAVRAAEGTPLAPMKEWFDGPTAVAIGRHDPVALAKVLKDFEKDNSVLTLKAGVVDGKPVEAADVDVIARIPSREALLGQLAYLLAHPLQGMANVLAAPLVKFSAALQALKAKK
jgi:ribosomal protein L10